MKKLVTKNNIHDFLIGGESEFYVNSSMIIAPGVKDVLRNKGVAIVYGNRKEDVSGRKAECKEEKSLDIEEKGDRESKMIKTIAVLLSQKFKITDVEMIKEVTAKVLNRIQG